MTYVRQATAWARDPGVVLPVLLIGAFVARAAWISLPPGSLIFDEAYYVNAARRILGLIVPPGGHYEDAPAGLDPNMEHPPLGKLLIALSMQLFGDNAVGWRLPSLILGMAALGAFYGILRGVGATVWLAILAVGFLAFDNLVLVHSRIGTLDILVLGPVLVGAWLGTRRRWVLAGAVIGIASLVKLTALYGVLALLLMLGWQLVAGWRRDHRIDRGTLLDGVALSVSFGVVSLAGLWALDSRFSSVASPIDHLAHMLRYGASLTAEPGRGGGCPGFSQPWQWLFNDCEINYLRVATGVEAPDGTVINVPTIDFRGAMNPVLAAAIPIAGLFAIWAAFRTGDPVARWAVLWAAANYLPFVFIALASERVMYLFYFLPVVPAVAAALAVLLTRSGLPRFVQWGFLVAFTLGFFAYYPFRTIP
jgi:predicted membrane-bound dolichyl-phosphate-mannose-protein mannosyltransferase